MQTNTLKIRPVHATALAIAAILLAVAEMTLFFRTPVDEWHPPSLIAMLCGLGAFFVGVPAIYMLRARPRVTVARTLAIVATLCGACAMFLFGQRSLHWRLRVQERETDNIRAIAEACRRYAVAHGNQFPPQLNTLAAAGELAETTLRSARPNSRGPAGDYLYAGAGINGFLWHGGNFDPHVITVYCSEPWPGTDWTVGFADGHAQIFLEEDFDKAVTESNAIRQKAGLPPADFDLPWHVETATTAPSATTSR